jgi:GT2 family glycosyltransferase
VISIVTVNYRTKKFLARMLESLFAHLRCDAEVFVVDNASGDDLSDLQAKFPMVKFIFSEKNLGFAGGCNLAIRQAKGDYALLVNPDIVFDADAACELARRMDADQDIGIGGIRLLNEDGTQQPCVWRFPRPLDQLLLLLKLPHLFPNLAPIDRWLMKGFDYSKTQDVDQVMGAFFCIRRAVIDEIGLLDDGFFLWYEEVDFAKRAADAGWKTRYYADVSARHFRGSSFRAIPTFRKQMMLLKSLARYARKHWV